MRSLPDPDFSLRDASDFIFDSELCRKVLIAPSPLSTGVFLRDVISTIYRLTVSCHLAEFTDHGLHHLCSLVDRLSRWTNAQGERDSVVGGLESAEATVLLFATLFHDIGMLSQRPEDMPAQQPAWDSKGFRDLPNWVRTTHIPRMETLVRRLFAENACAAVLDDPIMKRAFAVAKAHGSWPWDWAQFAFQGRDMGLAAMLAVADLLDEDSNRCDTATLLQHRFGNHLNCAHWIRHGLTSTRVLVNKGLIQVRFRRPPNTDAQLAGVFAALRNHYRLALLYLRELESVGAGILRLEFLPANGCPDEESPDLDFWPRLPGFHTQGALRFHLLNSFMPEALLDARRVAATDLQRFRSHSFEQVDLQEYHEIRGVTELHSQEEQAFSALFI